MKVYTHFKQISDKVGLRWRTILQFGDSWEIIGSVVMKNPGTSNFKSGQIVNLPELEKFDTSENVWYEFTPDATMNKIGDLFSFYYGTKPNGVIQIFNLFYIREGDLGKALKMDSTLQMLVSQDEMLKRDLIHLSETPYDSPIYLGFSSLAWNAVYAERAKAFFNATIEHYGKTGCYLNPDYDRNPFYHPLYLMCYGRNRMNCIKQLYAFKQNKFEPTIPDDVIINVPAKSSGNQFDRRHIINMIEGNLNLEPYDKPNHRYRLNKLFGITFADVTQHNGYVGIRAIPNTKVSNEEQERLKHKLIELGYVTTEKAWIGVKYFSSYGQSDNEIAKKICAEIKCICNFI